MTMNSYPTARYEVWLDTPTGTRLAMLDRLVGFSTVLSLTHAGGFTLALPDTIDDTLLRPDALVEVWRSVGDGSKALLTAGLVRHIGFADAGGIDTVMLTCEDGNALLRSRIVAYPAGSSQSSKTAPADDMMKAVVRENLGALATDTARNLSAYGITVDADLGLGPSLSKSFARKTVLDALNAIADSAAAAGTPVYFQMTPQVLSATQVGWLFQTFVNRLGADRTADSGQPTIFGREWGNLDGPRLDYDYTVEATYIYAGGQGEGADRVIATASDSARIGLSPWNRRERFVQGSNETTTAALTARANQALNEGKPKVRFSGALVDTPQTRYGVDWAFGDLVTASYRGRQFDGIVDAVRFDVDQNGAETITARIEVNQ